MLINHSFLNFNLNRFVFMGQEAPTAAPTPRPDLTNAEARTAYLTQAADAVGKMDKQDPNRKVLEGYLKVAEMNKNNQVAAKNWAEAIYNKLGPVAPQPDRSPRGQAYIGQLGVAGYGETEGRQTSNAGRQAVDRGPSRPAAAPTAAVPNQPAAAPTAAQEAKTASIRKEIQSQRENLTGTPKEVDRGAINGRKISGDEVTAITEAAEGKGLVPGQAETREQTVDTSWVIYETPAALFNAIAKAKGTTIEQGYQNRAVGSAINKLSAPGTLVAYLGVHPAGFTADVPVVVRKMPPKPGSTDPTIRFYLPGQTA